MKDSVTVDWGVPNDNNLKSPTTASVRYKTVAK